MTSGPWDSSQVSAGSWTRDYGADDTARFGPPALQPATPSPSPAAAAAAAPPPAAAASGDNFAGFWRRLVDSVQALDPSYAQTGSGLPDMSANWTAPPQWKFLSSSQIKASQPVFMGKYDARPVKPNHPGTQLDINSERDAGSARTITYQAALNLPLSWDEAKTQDTMKQMRAAGLPVNTWDQMNQAWTMLVGRASAMYMASHGNNLVTPWDALDLYRKEAVSSGQINKDGTQTRTQSSTSVYSMSDGDAWSALKQTVSSLLGRDPSDQEVRDYLSRVQDAANKAPTTSTTTATTDQAGNTTSSTDTKQGFGAGDAAHMATEDAMSNPEFGAYQAATTYANAFMQALGSTV